ncbi:MAG TPA: ATP-binding protein, partial [Candidatus Latescibacteria bacterium]|nr:ATP-binding protein [Candidatus Latescibacterota bacterium]
MATFDIPRTRDLLSNFDFQTLFIEVLGWNYPPAHERPRHIDEKGLRYTLEMVSELGGVHVFAVTMDDGDIPPENTRRAIHARVSELSYENLIVFLDRTRTRSLWYWVKREGGVRRPRHAYYFKGQPGDLFISKISSMHVDIGELDEKGNLPITTVVSRLQKALDIEPVTKKFFIAFDEKRLVFTKHILGIDNEHEQAWYASVLLNRLMFVYFLQKKGFLDNGAQDYLRKKLNESQKRGPNRFYREFLQELFFKGFAQPNHAPETEALLGQIPYLNGGLFLPHPIEIKYPNIAIPDAAFESILALFEKYSWSLDDTPGGKDDEINPGVLGYIFEKYINQKAFGAYYTRTEITEYLCEHTIHRLILDKVSSPGVPGFVAPRHFDSLGDLLLSLDAELCRTLLNDVLPSIRILDPACGSGAFLVAALKTLINVYSAVTGKIEYLNDKGLRDQLAAMRKEGRSLNYHIKRRIITDNLFGVDIMDEAVEIARLRLFLALVASVSTVEQLEPLPNIDFNVVPGNSLIGLMRVDDREFNERHQQGDLFFKRYDEVLAEKNRAVESYRHATTYVADLRGLRDEISDLRKSAQRTLNEILLNEFARKLKIKFEQATWDETRNA